MTTTRAASGWAVEVTDPSSNYTHQAPVVTGDGRSVSLQPKANARPGIRIPVRKADKWQAILGDGSSDVSMDVWHDGVRVPIDTLDDVDQTPDATVLVGSGGRELETRITDSIEQQAVHLAAQDYVDNNTAYTSNVDAPSTTTETNTTLATFTSNADFLVRIKNPTDFDPYAASGGALKQLPVGFFVEAEDATTETGGRGTTGSEDDNYSLAAGEVVESTGDVRTWDITPEHTIPADQVGIQVRDGLDSGSQTAPAFTWTLGGAAVDALDTAGTSLGALGWRDIGSGNLDGDGYQGGDLEAGETYTLKLEVDDGGTASDIYPLDAVFVYDDVSDSRFSVTYTFANATDGNDTLDGPQTQADEVQVPFSIVAAPEAVTGARGEATLNGGDSAYTHYLSNDQGANFTDGTGANFETDSLGANFGPGVTYKAGLSGFGNRTTASPNQDFNAQELQSLTLKADLEDMPIVVNTTFDAPLHRVLTQLASLGDQLWAYERDGSTESIEWTSPGQRTSTKDPQITDYETTKTTADVYQKARVYGRPDVTRTGERFESNHGVAVGLAQNRLRVDSEVVVDPDTGERYRRNEDYTLDYQAGEITVLAAGDMADASTFEVDYDYQPFGEFDDGTASPDVVDVNIPGLTTDFACEQAAQIIVDEVSSPLHTATVTIPNDDTTWSVVESLDPDIVPTGGNALHVREVVNTPEQTVLTLGSRRSLDDVVDDIRTQVDAVSRPT